MAWWPWLSSWNTSSYIYSAFEPHLPHHVFLPLLLFACFIVSMLSVYCIKCRAKSYFLLQEMHTFSGMGWKLWIFWIHHVYDWTIFVHKLFLRKCRYHLDLCKNIFGEGVYPDVEMTNIYYGGTRIAGILLELYLTIYLFYGNG